MNDRIVQIPYIVFEGEMARSERHIKRLWIAIIALIILTIITNVMWIWYISQYDFSSYDYEQDGDGVHIIGDSNGVDYNGTETENSQTDTEK